MPTELSLLALRFLRFNFYLPFDCSSTNQATDTSLCLAINCLRLVWTCNGCPHVNLILIHLFCSMYFRLVATFLAARFPILLALNKV